MNNSYFKDKVIIITGARRGIGKATSLILSDAGSRLTINSREADKLSEFRDILSGNGGDVVGIPGDISDEKVCENIVRKTLEKYGRMIGYEVDKRDRITSIRKQLREYRNGL